MKALLAVVWLAAVPAASFAQTPAFEGRPRFSEHTPVSYHVWLENGTWHVRFTSLGRARTFSGSISSEGGNIEHYVKIDNAAELNNLYPNRPRMLTIVVAGSPPPFPNADLRSGSNSSIKSISPTEIVFNSRVDDGIDGFDFSVDPQVTALKLNLRLDGKEKSEFVRIGQKGQKPDALPLVFQLHRD